MAKLVKPADARILDSLEAGSEVLARIQRSFSHILGKRREQRSDIAMACFWEELPVGTMGKVCLGEHWKEFSKPN